MTTRRFNQPWVLTALIALGLAADASAQPRRPVPPSRGSSAPRPPGAPPVTRPVPAAPSDGDAPSDDGGPPPDVVEPFTPPVYVPPPPPQPTFGGTATGPLAADFRNAVRILRVPGLGDVSEAEALAASEIFPDSDKVFMQVIGTDPTPIEAARRGARRWICASGCSLNQPQDGAIEPIASELLQSIKLQTPMNPLPLTIWQPGAGDPSLGGVPSDGSSNGRLLFDPRLMGSGGYNDRCAYAPVSTRAKVGDTVGDCWSERKLSPSSGPKLAKNAELFLGLRMPAATTNARFQYLAVTDSCGNAHVYPFQHSLSVPVVVASGGCGAADGRVLRVSPSGGFARVTAFNLDGTASGNVASVTYRVSVPALEDLVSAQPAPLLFPDVRTDELSLDCGPKLLPARSNDDDASHPSPDPHGGHGAPPHGLAPTAGVPAPPPPMAPTTARGSGQPLAHESLVIAPEPILGGNCRIEYKSQAKGRLIAPLALKVRVTRTDKSGPDAALLYADWVVTPTDSTFRLPKLPIDGESRLLVEVLSNPLSPLGNVVLLGDAGRYQRKDSARTGPLPEEQLQRVLGTATVHTAPLCGSSNFETADKAGKCFRGYFTVPAMLATLQLTRAPWVERPLITRSVLSAVGVAFAVDRYDPVERKAFPLALQLGGFVQDLSDSRLGLTSYLGLAPTVPVLGSGGNTTNIGLLGGVGMSYITRSNGPDEGFKPTAFLSVVVQVGQVNPSLQDASGNASGTMNPFNPGALTGGQTTPVY